MGDGANVFNTFSFNKWADGKREEEIDKESRRRRAEQVKRLKERLRKERALREAQGDGDLDLDALIEAIQKGQTVNTSSQVITAETHEARTETPRGVPDQLSDDYIFREIYQYASRLNGLNSAEVIHVPSIAPVPPRPDPLSWKYNRRIINEEMPPQAQPKHDNRNNFKFNRMMSSQY